MTYELLSRLVFAADSKSEAEELENNLRPYLHATRADYVETRCVHRIVDDVTGETFTIHYVIVYTGNLQGMIADLEEASII